MSLAAHILGLNDLRRECVHDPAQGKVLPGWESITQPLYATTLSADSLDELQSIQADLLETGGKRAARRGFRARLVAAGLVDANGERVFSAEQAEALGAKSGAALGPIHDAICRLNGLTQDASERAEKN